MNFERLPEKDRRFGHTWGFRVEAELDLPDDLPISLVMPVKDGMPLTPAVVKECQRCQAPVYQSKRNAADDSMYLLCYDCADALLPGWRKA